MAARVPLETAGRTHEADVPEESITKAKQSNFSEFCEGIGQTIEASKSYRIETIFSVCLKKEKVGHLAA